MKIINKNIENTQYTIEKIITILKKLTNVKFIESIDIAIHLNINPKKSDQNIKGYSVLPYGTGKKIKIGVFAEGENINIAKKAGATAVGMESLKEKILKNNKELDIIIATPDTMKIVRTLGKILGPKGLMPNPKTGTITTNIKDTIEKIKKGQIKFKNDKKGVIHTSIGKINFKEKMIKKNIIHLLKDIKKNKPKTSKGIFLKNIIISSTMGPGLKLNINSLNL